MSQQIAKTANETAIDAAESTEKLIEQAMKREIILVLTAFAACRTVGCRDHVFTCRTGPWLGGSQSVSLSAKKGCLGFARTSTDLSRHKGVPQIGLIPAPTPTPLREHPSLIQSAVSAPHCVQ